MEFEVKPNPIEGPLINKVMDSLLFLCFKKAIIKAALLLTSTSQVALASTLGTLSRSTSSCAVAYDMRYVVW
jgi:hypothetical protein